MYCKYCGSENVSDAKFCVKCGASVVEETTQDVNEQTGYAQPEDSEVVNAQPVYEQPVYTPPTIEPQKENGKGFAIAGMVCGIISLFCFAFILGTLGIVFGCVAKSKGYKGGMATAGIVCGVIGIIAWLVMLVTGYAV